MTQTTARIKQKGKNFEIIVDLEKALKYKKGLSNSVDFLEIDKIYSDSKKGFIASSKDLMECFVTEGIYEVASKIVKNGEVLVTQDFRDEEREKRVKQVVDFIVSNAIDPKSGRPHTPDRVKMALEQGHVNIKNVPIEQQIQEIIEQISSILPIKIQVKKVKVIIPAIHTGKVYGLISQYKEKENWLGNGDLEAFLNVPAGLILDFYDKLNSVTHGSALTEEVKED